MELASESWPVYVARERAQDWIFSVLNPAIDGLRRETSHLSRGGWRWQPSARRLEYIHPISDYLSQIYADNLDDFLLKFPKVRAEFTRHDGAVKALEDAAARAFDRLMREDAAELRRQVDALFEPLERDYQRYFLASIASGIASEGPNSVIAEHYNSNEELRGRLSRLADDELRDARSAAEKLEDIDRVLLIDLINLRTEIADRFGARIIPVG